MTRGLLTVHPLTIGIHETGLALAERYGLSIYDAMIAASTLHADCDTLWSKDMQDGMAIDDSLRIVNPFRVAGGSWTRRPRGRGCSRTRRTSMP